MRRIISTRIKKKKFKRRIKKIYVKKRRQGGVGFFDKSYWEKDANGVCCIK